MIPNSADFIIAFSCPLGHYSWRNPEYGSWFVQSICKIFDTHGYDMDLQSLFTEVARDVNQKFYNGLRSIKFKRHVILNFYFFILPGCSKLRIKYYPLCLRQKEASDFHIQHSYQESYFQTQQEGQGGTLISSYHHRQRDEQECRRNSYRILDGIEYMTEGT